jgi:hypothetical protein
MSLKFLSTPIKLILCQIVQLTLNFLSKYYNLFVSLVYLPGQLLPPVAPAKGAAILKPLGLGGSVSREGCFTPKIQRAGEPGAAP